MAQVYIRKIKTKKIEDETKKFLSEIKYVPRRGKIFIKPNIVGYYGPDSPCIVHPRVVGGIIEYLKDCGHRDIKIGELPVSKDVGGVFAFSGYKSLSRKYHVELLDLGEIKRVFVKFKDSEVALPALLLSGDYEYVNVAKMKTHILTQVSLCAKNQKGLLDLAARKMMHIRGSLQENIRHLAGIIKPDFSMIEGINALEGDGPGKTGRKVDHFNVLIAGRVMQDVDWIGAEMMGIDPGSIRHFLKPEGRVDVVGGDMADFGRKFLMAKAHLRKFNVYFWCSEMTCSGCLGAISSLKKSDLIKSPVSTLRFLYHALWKRVDILTGDADIPEPHGKVICLGDCMKKKAVAHKWPLISGCPPVLKNFSDLLGEVKESSSAREI